MAIQEDLVLVMAGTGILTVGVLALCGHFVTKLSREPILLWFGLFATPYGIALVCRSVFFPRWDTRAELFVVIMGKLVGLAASIPALLLFQEFYGKGWRLSSKWLIWIYALSLALVLFLMATHERSKSIPSPGITLVILVPLVLLIDRMAGYRPPPIRGRLAIFVGLFFFFLTFSYDHIANWRLGSVRVRTEPYGFIVLVVCLGYVVAKRVAINEAEWVSMTDEMRAAHRIQTLILPSKLPEVPGFSVAARYSPMTSVAGDYYGFPEIKENRIDIIVADVIGHGVPAALVASMIKVAVFASSELQKGPGAILSGLNEILCREAPGQLASAVYISLDRRACLGKYSSAGQPPPFLWRPSTRNMQLLDAAGLLLGVRNCERYDDGEFTFKVGDRLLIYSDGLTEAEDRTGGSFGDKKLFELFREEQHIPTESFATRLMDEVLAWSSNGSEQAQRDDITFVVLDVT